MTKQGAVGVIVKGVNIVALHGKHLEYSSMHIICTVYEFAVQYASAW